MSTFLFPCFLPVMSHDRWHGELLYITDSSCVHDRMIRRGCTPEGYISRAAISLPGDGNYTPCIHAYPEVLFVSVSEEIY